MADQTNRPKPGPHDYVGQLEVEPNTPIAPGETKELTLKISNPVLTDERLIPLRDPQQFIAGLLRFENSLGKRQMVTRARERDSYTVPLAVPLLIRTSNSA